MPHVIRIRDVARAVNHELGPEQRALRVPYEMFSPVGAVLQRSELVEWLEGRVIRRARFAEAELGHCHPGERVLVRLPPESDDEWWLCEVVAVDGVAPGRVKREGGAP